MNIPVAVLFLGLLVFLAHALEEVFARTRIPDVLLLLGLGIVLGPLTGLVRPESLGSIGSVFTTVVLVVILFEGGLGMDLKVVLKSLGGATGLTLWNFLGTLGLVSLLGRWMLGFTWLQAATLAAILGGTSSAVVIPLVRGLAIGERTRAVLAIESALSDVLVIVVALGLIEAQAMGTLRPVLLLRNMLASFVLAGLLGAGAGFLWSLLLDRLRALQKSIFTTPAFVFVLYGLTELLGFSGAIAALVMGITLGNIERLPPGRFWKSPEALASLNETERKVFAEVVFLMKTYLFVYVGASIQFSSRPLLLAGLLVTGLLFLVRIPATRLSLSRRDTGRFDASVSGAMAPKGLAAAVMASIPAQMGLPGGEALKLVVFAVVLFSILATSLLVFLIERGWFSGAARLVYGRYPELPGTGG